MDRAKRVTELHALGYVANERDWALGETIAVTHPSLGSRHDGIEVYLKVVYLRSHNGAWIATDLSPPAEPDVALGTWDEVLDYLDRRLNQSAPR